MTEFIPKDVSSITSESVGILDIQLVTIFAAHKAQEEVLGKKIVDAEKHPLLYSWVSALTNLPVIKESIPPHETLVAALKSWSPLVKFHLYFSIRQLSMFDCEMNHESKSCHFSS